jgi:DNA-binding beta-propeller fold protein YncE
MVKDPGACIDNRVPKIQSPGEMMRGFRMLLMLSCLFSAVGLVSASAQANWKVLKTIPVGGEGGWDYITVDAPNHRFFVTRSTHTQVIDENTGKVLGDIPGQIRSHGVALVPDLNRGFITDGGGSGAIIAFDLKTYAVLGKIPSIPDSDGIIYDSKQKRVLAVSGDGGALMAFNPDIDLKNGKLTPIPLGGSPEFLASDGMGKVFINLEDKDMIAVVDLKTSKVVARFPVTPGGHPVGMAMDGKAHLLFIGCRNPQLLVVMNTETGKVEKTLPIGGGVDADGFDAGLAFASCGEGELVVAAQKQGNWVVEQTLKTAPGARTMGVDRTTKRIFLPTAELEPGPGRPKPKPGSFKIIVVGES